MPSWIVSAWQLSSPLANPFVMAKLPHSMQVGDRSLVDPSQSCHPLQHSFWDAGWGAFASPPQSNLWQLPPGGPPNLHLPNSSRDWEIHVWGPPRAEDEGTGASWAWPWRTHNLHLAGKAKNNAAQTRFPAFERHAHWRALCPPLHKQSGHQSLPAHVGHIHFQHCSATFLALKKTCPSGSHENTPPNTSACLFPKTLFPKDPSQRPSSCFDLVPTCSQTLAVKKFISWSVEMMDFTLVSPVLHWAASKPTRPWYCLVSNATSRSSPSLGTTGTTILLCFLSWGTTVDKRRSRHPGNPAVNQPPSPCLFISVATSSTDSECSKSRHF